MFESYDVYFYDNNFSDSKLTYTFTTDAEVEYFLEFSNSAYLFNTEYISCSNIYDFSFYPANPKKTYTIDDKIKNTIIKSIKKFIEIYNVPILFVCDTTDGKGKARLQLFKRWFGLHNSKYNFQAIILELEFYSLPIGIISHISDPNFEKYFTEIDIMSLG